MSIPHPHDAAPPQDSADHGSRDVDLSIGGAVTGQAAAGNDNTQTHVEGDQFNTGDNATIIEGDQFNTGDNATFIESITVQQPPAHPLRGWGMVTAILAVLVIAVLGGFAFFAVPPAVSASPGLIDFDSVLARTRSGSRAVEIRNSGRRTLQIGQVSLRDEAFRILANSCPTGTAVQPGNSCQISIEFAPGVAGRSEAELLVTDHRQRLVATVQMRGDAYENVVHVVLPPRETQAGSGPTIRVSPSARADEVAIGSRQLLQLPVANDGPVELRIGSARFTGDTQDFYLGSGECGKVPPRSVCTIAVYFEPRAVGRRTATLELTHNGAGEAGRIVFEGNGAKAPSPVLLLPPGPEAFSARYVGDTVSRDLRVTNGGNAPMMIDAIDLVPSTGAFRIDGQGCTAEPVQPHQSCGIRLSFVPEQPGPSNAELVVRGHSSAGQGSVRLEGRAEARPAEAMVDPDSLRFVIRPDPAAAPSSPDEKQVVRVHAGGAVTLRIRDVAVLPGPGTFKIDTNCAARDLAPGQRCEIVVSFEAEKAGQFRGWLRLDTNTASGSIDIPLVGIRHPDPPVSRPTPPQEPTVEPETTPETTPVPGSRAAPADTPVVQPATPSDSPPTRSDEETPREPGP